MKRFILFISVFIVFLSCGTRVETENTDQSGANNDFLQPGDTLVIYTAFTVAPNGEIESVRIEKVEYSGSENKKPNKKEIAGLKKEVIRTIKKMGPFKGTNKRIRYHLPIQFVVKDD